MESGADERRHGTHLCSDHPPVFSRHVHDLQTQGLDGVVQIALERHALTQTVRRPHIGVTQNTGLGDETHLVCFAIEPSGERRLGRLVFERVLHRRRIRLDRQRLVHLSKTNKPIARKPSARTASRRDDVTTDEGKAWLSSRKCSMPSPKHNPDVVTKAA